MATIATNLLKDQDEVYKQNMYDCFNKSNTIQHYAKCLGPMLLKQVKLESILKKTKKSNGNLYKKIWKRYAPEKFGVDYIYPQKTQFNFPFVNLTQTSVSEEIAYFFISVLKNIKQKTGPWFKLPDLNTTIKIESNKPFQENVVSKVSLLQNLVGNFLKSPLLSFKDNPLADDEQEPGDKESFANLDSSKDNEEPQLRILSPRLMPFFRHQKEPVSYFSPDILSMYEGGLNNFASIPSLLSVLEARDKNAWMSFFREITGMSDVLEALSSPEFAKILEKWKKSTKSQKRFYMKDTFDVFDRTVEDVLKILTDTQIGHINDNGYTFLNDAQLEYVYKEKKYDLPFHLDDYLSKTEEEKNSMLYEEILLMSSDNRGRVKRELANSTILAPYLGGTVLTTYLLAPTILSPSVFSYVILGPLIISPFVLSPYVFAPFILSPEVLTPLILNPAVFSPAVINPGVLSPSVLSPIALSPFILSPFVLSPSILSPSVLSPNILSPGVLNPAILSDGVLSPAILSPCALCKKR